MSEYVGTRFYMVTERNTAGGNLQLHKGNKSNVAPNPLPSALMLGPRLVILAVQINSPHDSQFRRCRVVPSRRC